MGKNLLEIYFSEIGEAKIKRVIEEDNEYESN